MDIEHTTLSARITSFVEGLDGKDCTLGELSEAFGEKGFGMLLLLLAFPAALPIPAPGYATPFGILMIVLGSQMLRGYKTPQLPETMKKRALKYSLLDFSLKNGASLFRVVEFFVKPRLENQVTKLYRIMGLIIILMAAFMTLPIPLTNTAPSFVIFVMAASLLEKDGLSLIAGIILTPIALVIAGGAIYFALTYGVEAVTETFKPMIKDFLGMS
jgi:hypothetical protein